MKPVQTLRRRLALSLRQRVAGDAAEQRDARIWGTPGPRWLTPNDPAWRVHEDASMFAGGIRALFLQALHPLAMAGVAAHSGYRGDPWGRLARTATFIATTTFATIGDAEAAIAQVRSVHDRVRGIAPDGRPYAASDPRLLRWVHVAEIESFLVTHQAFGRRPLSTLEADEYVAQTARVATLLGADEVPTTVTELHQTIAAFRSELEWTPECGDTVKFLLRGPEMPLSSRPGYLLLMTGAVATLPFWARQQLRLPSMPWPVDGLGELVELGGVGVGHLGVRAVRWLMADPAVVHARVGQSHR